MQRESCDFSDVKAFFARFQVPHASKPTLLDSDTYEFRLARLREELTEFEAAHENKDLVEVADALVDLVYIALGTAHCMGLPWDKLWAEVQRANMTKVRVDHAGDSRHGSALDVVKPIGWTGPDHREALGLVVSTESTEDRPSLDAYLMGVAKLAAQRTTCIRRGVGCVLASSRGHILAVGYNGVASGMQHCNRQAARRPYKNESQEIVFPDMELHPYACSGYKLPPGQDSCEAIHAEQNALLQCRDPYEIETAYVTLSPCKACLKLLLNSGCRRIVVLEEHVDPMPKALWLKAGRFWELI